jgi:hypothetical protein
MAAILYKWLLFSAFLLVQPQLREQASATTQSTHPFYVSVTEVQHNAKDQALEISCKVFAEDLEQALKAHYKSLVDFSKDQNKEQVQAWVSDYFTKTLQIRADGKPAAFSIVGYEKEKESVFVYLQADHVSAPKKIDIQNTILYDVSESQINIMHVTVNAKRQSSKVGFPVKQASFVFK